MEVWRLLDSEHILIPAEQLERRLCCVKPGEKKTLHQVFRTGQGTPIGDAETASSMPFALIADDRIDVGHPAF